MNNSIKQGTLKCTAKINQNLFHSTKTSMTKITTKTNDQYINSQFIQYKKVGNLNLGRTGYKDCKT